MKKRSQTVSNATKVAASIAAISGKRKGSKDEAEFIKEFQATDLGKAAREGGRLVAVRRKTKTTSIVIETDLEAMLREKAAKRGLGYQTMLKMIVREHIDEY